MDLSIIKVLRKGNGINQTDLARMVGISQEYLSLVESNKRVPGLKLVEDICEVLNCELRFVLNR